MIGNKNMALIVCSECGKEFSDKASNCPNCGCPIKFILNQRNHNLCEDTKEPNYSNFDDSKKEIMIQGNNKNSKVILGSIIIVFAVIIFVVYTFVPKEIAYQSAKKEMVTGNKISALNAFIAIDSYKDSIYYIDKIKSETYNEAINFYHKGEYSQASSKFLKIYDYKKSKDYLYLICTKLLVDDNSESFGEVLKLSSATRDKKVEIGGTSYDISKKMIAMLEFEDTKDVILNSYLLEYFLEGSWESDDGAYYYTVTNRNGVYEIDFSAGVEEAVFPDWYTSYNIPWYEGEHYKYEKGIHYVGSDTSGWKEQYKFLIKSANKINVYCFKNGRTYQLYRL